MAGARPVYISKNATKDGVKEQVKLLWGFSRIGNLGVETEVRPFLGAGNETFCEFIIGEFSFENMDDDDNLFTVSGTDAAGAEKVQQYRFFHTFAYGGLSMVRVEDWEEFKLVPEYRFLKELNPIQNQLTPRGMFGRGMNSVNTLLRERERLERLDAELKAREESIAEKKRLSRQLLQTLRASAFHEAVFFTAFEEMPELKTRELTEQLELSKAHTEKTLRQADELMKKIEEREPDRVQILMLQKEVDTLKELLDDPLADQLHRTRELYLRQREKYEGLKKRVREANRQKGQGLRGLFNITNTLAAGDPARSPRPKKPRRGSPSPTSP